VITPRFRHAAATLLVAVLATGCEDPFEQTAQRSNFDSVITGWALSGSPLAYPSALYVPQLELSLIEPTGTFDLAFDIDETGRLVVLPMTRVVTPLSGNRSIGLMRGTQPYAAIVEAPQVGWQVDSALTVSQGGSFLARVQTRFCQFDVRQEIFAKFYVESVDAETRQFVLLARVNPNCGYRSLLTGIPEF
jgi:hypothetical protein